MFRVFIDSPGLLLLLLLISPTYVHNPLMPPLDYFSLNNPHKTLHQTFSWKSFAASTPWRSTPPSSPLPPSLVLLLVSREPVCAVQGRDWEAVDGSTQTVVGQMAGGWRASPSGKRSHGRVRRTETLSIGWCLEGFLAAWTRGCVRLQRGGSTNGTDWPQVLQPRRRLCPLLWLSFSLSDEMRRETDTLSHSCC